MFKRVIQTLLSAILGAGAFAAYAGDTTPAAQLQRFEAAAGRIAA